MKINWNALKTTIADGKVYCSVACLGLEYRHNPQTASKAESIEVHDGADAIKVHRQGKGWTRPYRVIWS